MKRSGGYMLLEVVLALSIFIVAVVGLVACLNSALDADYYQRRLTNTRLTLQSLLDQSLVLTPVAEKAEFPEDLYHVSYRREVAPVDVKLKNGKALNNIYKVTVQALDVTKDNRVIGELWTYVAP